MLPRNRSSLQGRRRRRRRAEGTCYLSAWFANASRDFRFKEDVINLGRYGKTLTVLHATQIPDDEEMAQQDLEEDPEADKFNLDGKGIRF